MGRKVGKIFYFKKKFCPIFYFMTHLFPTAQLKKQRCGSPKAIIFFLYVLLNQIRDNHIFTKDWQWLRRTGEKRREKKRIFFFFFFIIFFFKAIKFTESAAFCRVGRVTGNNNKFLLGLMLFCHITQRRYVTLPEKPEAQMRGY